MSVRLVDSDVVVLAVGLFNDLAPLEKLFVEYGISKNFQVLPAHEIAAISVQKLELCPYSMHYLGVTATHPPPIVANLKPGIPGTSYPD